jgi:NitT/TauT family transport system substrate-binding protein
MFPSFAKLHDVDATRVNWIDAHPALRENFLVGRAADAISLSYFTTIINLESQNTPERDLTVMRYADYGLDVYSSSIIASKEMIAPNPG